MRKTLLLALVASLSACSLAPSAPRQLECRTGFTISLGRDGEPDSCVPMQKIPRPLAPLTFSAFEMPDEYGNCRSGFTITLGRNGELVCESET